MNNEALVQTLLSIIGVLLMAIVGYFLKTNEQSTKEIKFDLRELKDMFIRHVRDAEIHLPRHRQKGA